MKNEAVLITKFHTCLAIAWKIGIKLEQKLPDILMLGKCQTALRFAGDLLTGRQRKNAQAQCTQSAMFPDAAIF